MVLWSLTSAPHPPDSAWWRPSGLRQAVSGAPEAPRGVPTIGGRAFRGASTIHSPLPGLGHPFCRAAPSREPGGLEWCRLGGGAVGPGGLADGDPPPPWFVFPPVMTCVSLAPGRGKLVHGRGVGNPHREHGLGREGCCQLRLRRKREPRFVVIGALLTPPPTLDRFVVISPRLQGASVIPVGLEGGWVRLG